MAVTILVALFAAYVLATLWQLRRAVATSEPQARQREAVRALIVVAAGLPLLVALIFFAL